jgi:hypothetical protein
MKKRVKKLSQKLQDGTFSSPCPIGVDSIYADMLSGSNLEQEMHLGSPNVTSFGTDSKGNTVITEEYKKEDSQTSDYYKMTTTFQVVDNEMSIVQKLYFINNGSEDLEKTKTITFISAGDSLQIKEVIE